MDNFTILFVLCNLVFSETIFKIPRPADVIRPRPKLPRIIPPADATVQLHQQLTEAIEQLLAEYLQQYGESYEISPQEADEVID